MSKKKLILVVSTLRTDREVEVVHYQVGGDGWRFSGEHVKRLTVDPYRLEIGEVPESWQAELHTPDPRLELIEESIK